MRGPKGVGLGAGPRFCLEPPYTTLAFAVFSAERPHPTGASSVYAPQPMSKALSAEGGHSPPQARNFLGCVCFYSKKWCFLHDLGRPSRQRRALLPVLLIAHRIKQQIWVWGLVWEALATHGVSASPPFRPSTCACGRKPFWMLWLHMECDGNARRDGGGDSISQPRRRDAGGSSIHLNRGTGHHGTAARTNTDTRSARRMSRCPSSQRYETRRLDDDGVRLTDRCKTFLGQRDGPGTIIYRCMWR